MPLTRPMRFLPAGAAVSCAALALCPAHAGEAPPPLVIPPPVAIQPPLVVPPPVKPPPALAPEIRAMIEAAVASGDAATAQKVIAIARKVAPEAADGDIDAIEKAWKADVAARHAAAEEKRLASLRGAGPLDNWKGNVEFGAYRSTGSSSNLGLLGSLALERTSIDWTHKLIARADLQRTDGETSSERLLASWQPNYRFDKSTYAFGLAQYEHDPFAGYDDRYTLGGGFGYRALSGPRMQLDLEGGPALRYTDSIEGITRSRIVGRGSLNFRWQLTPTLKLTQQSAFYLESDDSNATLTTAVDTKVIGDLQARFSYNVQYEGNSPAGTQGLNTQSRVTFVYGF